MMSTQFPTACPAGTYRSSGDTDCQPCPANTIGDQVATGHCQCQCQKSQEQDVGMVVCG